MGGPDRFYEKQSVAERKGGDEVHIERFNEEMITVERQLEEEPHIHDDIVQEDQASRHSQQHLEQATRNPSTGRSFYATTWECSKDDIERLLQDDDELQSQSEDETDSAERVSSVERKGENVNSFFERQQHVERKGEQRTRRNFDALSVNSPLDTDTDHAQKMQEEDRGTGRSFHSRLWF
eukprot:TRINITY_DN30967_c0_g1_i1.p1 TRINITY_DN30967_c0_g1~~TRINITY_DN30967_c0_g1_i1.p1  ORF type:complete len:192 (-),score=34.58 TRINITY_DN30967_c0_g1_i1:33-572(-)